MLSGVILKIVLLPLPVRQSGISGIIPQGVITDFVAQPANINNNYESESSYKARLYL